MTQKLDYLYFVPEKQEQESHLIFVLEIILPCQILCSAYYVPVTALTIELNKSKFIQFQVALI